MKKFLLFVLLLAAGAGVYYFYFYKTPEVRTFEQNLAQAKQGNASAMYQAGLGYEKGVGTQQNNAQAVELFRQAASAGNTEAMNHLAKIYEEGKMVPQDLEEAVVYLQIAAAKGDANAQIALSRYFRDGKGGLTQSEGESLLWLSRAAKQNNAAAMQALKEAQEKNPELYEAVMNFEENLAGASEDAQKAFAAAQAYRKGNPGARNDEEAFKLFKSAWEKDPTLSQAAVELAEMYRLGEGTEKDDETVLSLYAKAAELQNPQAQYFLGKRSYEENPPNYQDAFAWLSNSAAQGYAPAQYMTGYMLLQGQGTARSLPMAIDFFTKSADQNFSPAQYVLGQMYWKGLGVKKDTEQGRSWIEKAADNGNESAQTFLANL